MRFRDNKWIKNQFLNNKNNNNINEIVYYLWKTIKILI